MKLEFVPLLKLQRDLYNMPRGMDRFQEYLRLMVNEEGNDLRLPPLVLMNPMAKDHVATLIDALIALDSEDVAKETMTAASEHVVDLPGDCRAGIVVADDALGGWTNRYTSELKLRWIDPATRNRGWLAAVLWSSEPPVARTVHETVLTTIFRTAYVHHRGAAQSLRELMTQEGYVMAKAGCTQPRLDGDDLSYTREVIEPHLDAHDQPTIVACLFGDEAARSLGYPPQGLSERAGLALALHEAQAAL